MPKVINPLCIACTPFPPFVSSDGRGLSGADKLAGSTSLTELRVVFDHDSGKLKAGDTVYVRSERRSTTDWARRTFKLESTSFIMVPLTDIELAETQPG